jgi:plastocyanin
MASEDEPPVGPRLVWTFPLATRVQQRTRVFNIGNNVLSILDSIGGQSSKSETSQPDTDTTVEDIIDDGTDELRDQLDEVSESGEELFEDLDYGADEDIGLSDLRDTGEVVIEDDVAFPPVADIDEGESVTWINQDSTTRRIRSIEGESFDSGQLEQGEIYEHEFNTEGTTIYIDTIAGGSQLSGAVVVGDAEPPDTLPSEDETEIVPFDLTGETGIPQSMSRAAKQVSDMERGFD